MSASQDVSRSSGEDADGYGKAMQVGKLSEFLRRAAKNAEPLEGQRTNGGVVVEPCLSFLLIIRSGLERLFAGCMHRRTQGTAGGGISGRPAPGNLMRYNQARMVQNDYIEARDGGFYIKETRVPLDSIVHEFYAGSSPESIRQAFPTLALEQVYGAITFYLGHQSEVDASIRGAEQAWAEFEATHPTSESLQVRLREARGGMTSQREQ